jgi:hypothetical protein
MYSTHIWYMCMCIYIYINIRCMIFSPWISLVILMIVPGCHRGQGIEVDGVGAVSVLRPVGTRFTLASHGRRFIQFPKKIPVKQKVKQKNSPSLLKSHSRQNRRQATW